MENIQDSKTLLEGIRTENFSNLVKDRRDSRKPKQNKQKETILSHITVKLKVTERTLKAARGKRPINRKQKFKLLPPSYEEQ